MAYTGSMNRAQTPMPGLPDAHARPILGPGDSLVPRGCVVAKKSPAKPKASAAKRAPARKGTQPNAITIRGSEEWKGWLDRFAAKLRSKPTAVIDLALAKLAQQEGFPEPPPRMSA